MHLYSIAWHLIHSEYVRICKFRASHGMNNKNQTNGNSLFSILHFIWKLVIGLGSSFYRRYVQEHRTSISTLRNLHQNLFEVSTARENSLRMLI